MFSGNRQQALAYAQGLKKMLLQFPPFGDIGNALRAALVGVTRQRLDEIGPWRNIFMYSPSHRLRVSNCR